MKKMKTVDAVGQVLFHDITQIIKDVSKKPIFKKGHQIREEDIPVLLSVGKDHIYIWEMEEGMVHENEAAQMLVDWTRDEHMTHTPVSEGKMELIAQEEGMFLVNKELLLAINLLDEVMIASIPGNFTVRKGDRLAGMRIIPLMIAKEKLEEVPRILEGQKLFSIVPYQPKKVGIVTTGNEIYHGRIQDRFAPVIIDKIAQYHMTVIKQIVVYDDTEKIKEAILSLKEDGVDMILCTGGMSVDPDDLTPGAIAQTGAEIVTYGTPVLPGSMFLLGYFQDGTPIVGLPGSVMFKEITVFDLLLPHLASGLKIDKTYIASLGYGGLCIDCPVCHYPNCQFGKGV